MSVSFYSPSSNDLPYPQKNSLIETHQAVTAKNVQGLKVTGKG